MVMIADVMRYLEREAPLEDAESWDNVGLLMGDPEASVTSIMTCLTITDAVVGEALERGVQLVVTHHPMPFQPLNRLTTDRLPGRHVWRLATRSIAVYSSHTAFDSAVHGINQTMAESLELQEVAPLLPFDPPRPSLGAGRHGRLDPARPLGELADRIKRLFDGAPLRVAGDPARHVARIALACGAGGAFLDAALEHQCDVLITGEATFHTVLQGLDSGAAMILTGHYASERFAMELLAQRLQQQFPDLSIWPSQAEQPPWQTW